MILKKKLQNIWMAVSLIVLKHVEKVAARNYSNQENDSNLLLFSLLSSFNLGKIF